MKSKTPAKIKKKPKLTASKLSAQVQLIERRIYFIRSQKVMSDLDLAELYGVETRVLVQAVNTTPAVAAVAIPLMYSPNKEWRCFPPYSAASAPFR